MNPVEIIKELAYGITHASTGEDFFRSLAQSLANALHIDYVFIGELIEQTNSIHSIAFIAKGQLIESVQYPVVGTLCEFVIQPKFCAFPRQVQQQFPHNQNLKYYNVDSYIGIPLLSSQKKVLGILYIMHTKAIEDVEQIENVLSLVAKRAELELERSLYEKRLLAQNQALLEANEELARTRQALLEVNQQLEIRVEERTKELSVGEEELRQSLEQLSYINRTLSEREAFLASIVDQTSVGICVVSQEGQFVFVNEGYCRITGRTQSELLSLTLSDITYAEDQHKNFQQLENLRKTGQNFEMEKRYVRPDGLLVWCLISVSRIQQEEGLPIRTLAVCQDITERKLSEEFLQQSRQQERESNAKIEQQRRFLYLLFSQVPAIISVVRGQDLVYELANKTLQKFTGRQQYLGKTVKEVYPEMESSLYQIYQQVYHTGEPFLGQSYPIHLDWDNIGKPYVKYFDIVYEPFKNEQGKVDGVISFGYEVTSQVEARRILEKSEAQIRLILESIPHLAWTSLPESSINYFNRRWYEYTGLTEEQSLRLGWQTVVHPDDLPIAIERRTIGRGKGEPYEVENRYRKGSDGSYRWHLARVVPIRNEDGKITLWVGTATDIHDQKTTQHALENTLEELNEKNYELDQFVYKTSHDLRAPLTTIMGLVTILKLEKNEATKTHYIDLIETRVQKLDMFIKSMLDYSRNTRTATKYELINLETLLQECVTELEYMRNFDRLRINLQIHEAHLYSDVFRLKIIFSNLISNAIKYQDYNKPESYLNIQVMPAGKQMIITFTDNGVGIDQAYQDRIFNMFFRAAEQSEGSGLGLYIVKQAATVLQGNIHLASKAGKGTTFTVTLPKLYPDVSGK